MQLRLIILSVILSLEQSTPKENFIKKDLGLCEIGQGEIGNILSDTVNQYSFAIINYGTSSSDVADNLYLSFNTNTIQDYSKNCGIELSLIDLSLWNNSRTKNPVKNSLPFSHAEIVFLVSNDNGDEIDFKPFYAGIQKIAKRLSQDLNPWLTWTPLFFIIWPTLMDIYSNNTANLTKILESIIRNETESSFPLNSDVFIIVPTRMGYVKQHSVYEIYALSNKTILREVVLPVPNSKVFSNYLWKSGRRRNFDLAQSDPDYNLQIKFKPSLRKDDVQFESDVSLYMFLALEYSLNFSHTAVQGDGWLEQLENGTWIGMGKQSEENEADIAISFSMSLPERLKNFDFLHAVSYGSIKAFFRQPSINSLRNIYIAPFKNEMWFCLLIFWIVVIFSFRGIIGLRKRQNFDIDNRDCEMMNESMLWIVSTVCLKGWHITPMSISMRIIFACASFTGFIYFVAYSASLVSTLSIEVTPIKTLKELAQSPLELLGDFWLPNSPAIVQELEMERIKQYPSYRKPIKENQFVEIDQAIPKIMSTPSTFLTFSDGFLTVFHRFNYTNFYCDTFSSIGVSQAPLCSGYAVKKGSNFKEFFNAKLLMIQERGVLFRNNQIYFRSTSASCTRKSVNHFDLGLIEIFTAFLFLFVGAGTSLGMIVVEKIFSKYVFLRNA